jgi:hypothetical protein
MATERVYIDATDDPSLTRLANEVRDTKKQHVLKLGNEEVAVISPIRRRRKGRVISKADYEAFLSSFGGWADVDTDKLIEDIYASRRMSTRPPVEL